VFYSLDSLPPFWQTVSRFNPFFYMIDGFRYGFLGAHDGAPTLGLAVSTGFLLLISLVSIFLLHKGYKLRH